MGADSKIQWTDHTFNAWWGCTKVSDGCDNCYAEKWDKRTGGAHWGKGAERRVFGEKHWREPLKWNGAAAAAGTRARVFCSSMADVFDAEAPAGQLERLWHLIAQTPHLDWLLLTKRPARIARSLPATWGDGWRNVWLGTTVENQEQAEIRIPVLLNVPARVRFLSCEPLLGPVDLTRWIGFGGRVRQPIDWVIVGGESGPGARPFDLAWARSLRDQCAAADVACFMKQLGARPTIATKTHADEGFSNTAFAGLHRSGALSLADKKGGDWSEWPADLRVRQLPEVRR